MTEGVEPDEGIPSQERQEALAEWHHNCSLTGDLDVDLSLALEESRKENGRDEDRSRSPPPGQSSSSISTSAENVLKRNAESEAVQPAPAKKATAAKPRSSEPLDPQAGRRGRVREAVEEIERRASTSVPRPKSPRTLELEAKEVAEAHNSIIACFIKKHVK